MNRPMLCPHCKEGSIPYWKILLRIGYHRQFKCANCGLASRVSYPWFLRVLYLCLISVGIYLGINLVNTLYIWAVVPGAILVGAVLEYRFAKMVPTLGEPSKARFILPLAFLFIASWTIFVVAHEEAIDPGLREFYYGKHIEIQNAQNAAIGIDGLNAPSGSDFMARGVLVNSEFSKHPDEWNREDALISKTGLLSDTVKNGELDCNIWPDTKNIQACANDERVRQLLVENKELLDRYWQITRLSKFGHMHENGGLFLTINKLINASILMDARNGQIEKSYTQWRDNFQLLIIGISSENTLIDKAILMVAYRMAISSIESMLYEAPSLVGLHGSDLIQLLQPAGIARWNLEGALRAEYMMLDPALSPQKKKFWYHENFVKNRFYRFSQAYLSATEHSSIAEIETALLQVKKQYATISTWNSDYLKDPLNSFFSRIMLGGLSKTTELLKSMIKNDGMLRLLILRVHIQQVHISDIDIPKLIENANQGLDNLYKDQVVHWDEDRRVLWLDNDDCSRLSNQVRLPGGKWNECANKVTSAKQ